LKASQLVLALAALAVQSTALPCWGQINPAEEKTKPNLLEPIKGRWGDAIATMSLFKASNTTPAPTLQTWSGALSGVINERGEMRLIALNGCVIEAKATPLTTLRQWTFSGHMQYCKIREFDRPVFGQLRLDGTQLILEIQGLPPEIGPDAKGHELSANLTRQK